MKRNLVLVTAVLCVLAIHSVSLAGNVTIPNIFTPGTPAKADSVNENFTAVELAVDDNAAMISSLLNAHATTRTEYVSLHPWDFTPIEDGYNYFNSGNGLNCYAPATAFFNAGLHFPHGAVIKQITAYYYDSNGTDDFRFNVTRVNGTGAASGIGPELYSSGSAGYGSVSSAVSSLGTVDNINYSYAAGVMCHPNASFIRAVIEYEYMLD